MCKHLIKIFVMIQLSLLASQTTVTAQAPWKWLHPYPTGSFLNDVYVFNPDQFIAVGFAGTVIRKISSTDSMETVVNLMGEGLLLNDVFFLNDQVGWICGEHHLGGKGVVLKTTDGGQNWHYLLEDAVKMCKKIYFINENIGWATCLDGYLLKTTDGGQNWETIDMGLPGYDFAPDLYFMDADSGIALGLDGKIYRTTDGGQNWSEAFSVQTHSDFTGLSFPASSNGKLGWAVGLKGIVVKTTDYGRSWQQLSTGDDVSYHSVCFLNDTLGWIANDKGNISKTSDGGNTWQKLESPNGIESLFFIDENNGYAVGDYGLIINSKDGGQSWQALNTNYTSGQMRLLYFFNEDSIWALGDNGAFFCSTDNGYHWSPRTPIKGCTSPRALTFNTPDTGWIVEASSYVMRSTDSGATWATFYDVNDRNLDISFVNAHNGWICGEKGKLLHTTDGGKNWQNVESGTDDELFRIVVLDEQTLVIVGRSGTILRYDEAQGQWNSQTLAHTYLSDVYFLNSQTGWVISNDGKMWKTTDGGNTWTRTWEIPQNIKHFLFQNDKTGWAIVYSKLLSTNDSGETWQNVCSFDDVFDLRTFYILDENRMILLGDGGSIYQLNLDELVGVEVPAVHPIPVSMQLFQNYPNPFNPVTNIRYRLAQGGPVHLAIYNLLGQRVRTLVNLRQSPGEYTVRWDGRNEAGRPVSSGLYFYRLQTGDKQLMRKMLLVR